MNSIDFLELRGCIRLLLFVCIYLFSCPDGGQGYGAALHWWCVWRQCETHSLPLSDPEDAADPTRKGHCGGVHQK